MLLAIISVYVICNYPTTKGFSTVSKKRKKNKPKKRATIDSEISKPDNMRSNYTWGTVCALIILSCLGVLVYVLRTPPPEREYLEGASASVPKERSFEGGLALFKAPLQELFKDNLDKELVEKLEKCNNLAEAVILIFKDISPNIGVVVNNFINESSQDILNSKWGGKLFSELGIKEKLDVIGSYLTRDKGFVYMDQGEENVVINESLDSKNGFTTKALDKENPAPYLLTTLLEESGGNCATLPLAFAMLAQSLNLQVKLVTIDDHQFCRFDDGETRINIEATNPNAMGVGQPDSSYLRDFRCSELMLRNSTTMKSQTLRESISSLYVNKMAYFANSSADSKKIKNTINMSIYFDKNSVYGIRNLYNFIKKGSTEANSPVLDELEEIGRHIGVIEPQDQKAVEGVVSEILGSFKTLKNKLSTYKKETSRHRETLRKIDQETNLMYSNYSRGMRRSEMSNDYSNGRRDERNEINRKMQERQKFLEKKKFVTSSQRFKAFAELRGIHGDIKTKLEIVLSKRDLLSKKTLNELYLIQMNNNKILQGLVL
jgi:hypothetical protein